jgi:hypothetical protein
MARIRNPVVVVIVVVNTVDVEVIVVSEVTDVVMVENIVLYAVRIPVEVM